MSVAAWQARPGEVMPDWPATEDDPPGWLKKLAKRLWEQQAALEHFVSDPSQNGRAQSCRDFAEITIDTIDQRLSQRVGTYPITHRERTIDRELVTLRHQAEHCLAQWQLLCAAYPQTVWEVPF